MRSARFPPRRASTSPARSPVSSKSIDFKANDNVNAGQVARPDRRIRSSVPALPPPSRCSPSTRTRFERTQQLFQRQLRHLRRPSGRPEQARSSQGLSRADPGDTGAKGDPGAVRRHDRHSEDRCRPISPGRHRDRDAAGPQRRCGSISPCPSRACRQLKIGQAVSLGLVEDHLDLSGDDHRHRPEDRSELAPHLGPGGGRQFQGHAAAGPVRPPARPPAEGAEHHRRATDGGRHQPLWQLRLSRSCRPAAPSADSGNAAASSTGADKTPAKPQLVAKQIFVQTGRRLDTEIEIIKGLEAGDADRLVRPEQAVQRQPRRGRQQRQPGRRIGRRQRTRAMNFSELFIRRPVLSTVVSLLILLLGAQGITNMPIRQYPKVDETVITVTTAYPGASADVIQGFITSTIAKAVSSAEGVDYVTSQSALGVSTVSVHMRLNADPNKSLTEVMAKVQQVRGQLPSDARGPGGPEGHRLLLRADVSGGAQRQHEPAATDRISDARHPAALRHGRWRRRGADPRRAGIRHARVDRSGRAGRAQGNRHRRARRRSRIRTSCPPPAAPRTSTTPIRSRRRRRCRTRRPSASCRSAAAATTSCGCATSPRSSSPPPRPTSASSSTAATASSSASSRRRRPTRSTFRPARARSSPRSRQTCPRGCRSRSSTIRPRRSAPRSTRCSRPSPRRPRIVVLVILLFLGSFRSVVIPIVTIPLSLIGVCFLMWALGYSLNTLTLLAMVLAIGLVVDDAIVVVENIHRHVEEGIQAARRRRSRACARSAGAIIAMTITLAAVFAPIAFTTGVTGSLFREFALTLAGAVVISGFVALTLSPMMSARLLTAQAAPLRGLCRSRLRWRSAIGTSARLTGSLNIRWLTLLIVAALIGTTGFLFTQHLDRARAGRGPGRPVLAGRRRRNTRRFPTPISSSTRSTSGPRTSRR